MRSDDPDSSDDASTSDSDSNNSIQNRNSLIDDEAEESGEEPSSGHDSRNGDAAPRPAFPQFMQLPPELRHQIWHLYCPDLSAKARVLQFSVGPSSAILQRPDHYSVKDHSSLADQTESLRVLLSMNSESRSIALRKYPDELIMDAGSGNAIVRFRKETDVVILTDWKPHRKYFLPGFADNVESVSVNQMECYREELGIDDELDSYDGTVLKVVPAMKDLFPNLKRLFTLWPGLIQSTDLMEEWCETDFVHTYMVETHERESGLGEDTKSLFCWPDLDEYAEFTQHIPRVCSPEKIKDSGLEVWPLVEFESQSGIKIYEKMRRLYFNPQSWPDSKVGYRDDPTMDSSHITLDDSDSDADFTDLNEYESEGIDDEEIIEIEGSSEEDELLQGEPGRFSSPESDEVEVLAEVDTEPVQPVPRSRKRKAIVVDSDDDEEEAEEKSSDDEDDRRQNKRAKLTRLVLDSDDEEEGGGDDVQHDQNEIEAISTRRAPKSSHVMLGSSDDQSDNDGDIYEENTRRGPVALDSDSEEEDEEDEDVAPTKLPLAKLLRRARSENTVSSASEGDSGQTDEESESEEDQSNDDDDDDEDENEHGLFDTMAGDGTAEEEDEDENEDEW
ncbi:hypothetical protein E4U58_005738 [Claviceps cyperi]|nr:hypothetical protein E4U58_005738 [Claviceps cyperi]